MEKRRIVDKRKKEKFIIDDDYLNGMAKLCGWQGTIVYNSLCRHSNLQQESFPSIKLMREQHNVSRNTIIKGIYNLEKRKVIEIKKSRTKTGKWLNNTYILLDKSEWNFSQVPHKDLAIQVLVVTQPSPCEGHGVVHEKDTKETHSKETHYKEYITIGANAPREKIDFQKNKKTKKNLVDNPPTGKNIPSAEFDKTQFLFPDGKIITNREISEIIYLIMKNLLPMDTDAYAKPATRKAVLELAKIRTIEEITKTVQDYAGFLAKGEEFLPGLSKTIWHFAKLDFLRVETAVKIKIKKKGKDNVDLNEQKKLILAEPVDGDEKEQIEKIRLNRLNMFSNKKI